MPEVDKKKMEADSRATINKRIAHVKKTATAILAYIHETALMCMEHAQNYGDTSLAANLVDSIPLAYRRALVINWFDTFSPISIAKDGKTGKMKGHLKGKADAGPKDEGYRDWQIEPAKATPFYAMPEVQNEPDVPTYETIHKNVVSFIKRMRKQIEGTNERPGIQDGNEKEKALAEIAKLEEAVAA